MLFSFFMTVLGVASLALVVVLWRDLDAEPVRGVEVGRADGSWTRKTGFKYPPGLVGSPRSEFSEEEIDFIEAFWLPREFHSRCDDAGLYKSRRTDEGEEVREYPQVVRFQQSPTGVAATVVARGAVTPSDVEAGAERLMNDVVGGSRFEVRRERDRVVIVLASRDPLDGVLDSAEAFGHIPAEREVTAAEFFAALDDDGGRDE